MGGNPYKKADQAKKKAPGAKQKAAEAKIEEAAVEMAEEKKMQEGPLKSDLEAKAEKKVEKPVAKAEPKAKEKLDIFAKLNTEKPTAKNVTFYLSDENITKLKKMAEKKGVSTSKLLDHILSEVL